MKTILRLFRIPKIIINLIPVLTRNQLRGYTSSKIFSPVDRLLKFCLSHLNKISINLIPISVSALLTNYALEANELDKALMLAKRAQRNRKSRRLAFNYEIQIAGSRSKKSRDEHLSHAISEQGIKEERFGAALLWAFWNLSLLEYADFIRSVLGRLEERQTNSFESAPRLLPEFTTNMGHLGYLVSYLGFYKIEDPKREIVLWPDQAPNKYYMKLVIDQSPLKITAKPGKSMSTFADPGMTDSLIFSRKSTGVWRFEHNAAVCSGQNFPELTGAGSFKLKFPIEKEIACINELERMGFIPHKWFVILHIRESSLNKSDSTQARDSEITKFIDFCNLIADLGGQVVRMGSNSFPKLTSSFQAVDYAHGAFANDMIDCWLWANCRWWTGNANGASLAAHAFGAPRMIVDQWFWDNFGPSNDLYLPKIVVNEGIPLTADETISHKLSRNMNMKVFSENNLSFRSNTSQEIVSAALDMYEQVNSNITGAHSQLNGVDRTLSKLLRNIEPLQTMRIAPSYRTKIDNILQ